eukprot:2293638-Amphidinium_carterae.1
MTFKVPYLHRYNNDFEGEMSEAQYGYRGFPLAVCPTKLSACSHGMGQWQKQATHGGAAGHAYRMQTRQLAEPKQAPRQGGSAAGGNGATNTTARAPVGPRPEHAGVIQAATPGHRGT